MEPVTTLETTIEDITNHHLDEIAGQLNGITERFRVAIFINDTEESEVYYHCHGTMDMFLLEMLKAKLGNRINK